MKRVLALLAAAIVILGVALVAAYALFPDRVLEIGRRIPRYEAGLSLHTVTAAGHRIAYLEGGHGEPLVLLHGFGGNKDGWPPLARRLTAYFHLYLPDLPGFGESTRDPSADYDFAAQAERVEAFTRAVGLNSPFHLGGNSMGGGIAGLYAARHPERLKSLWLIDPVGVSTATPSEYFRAVLRGENPLIVATPEQFDALLDWLFVHRPWIPPGFLGALARDRAAHADFDAKVFADLRAHPLALEPLLRGSHVPTLVTWGAQDRVLDSSGAAILGSLMPMATVDVLPGVGHVPMMEAPQVTAEHFLDFVHRLR